MKQHLIFFIVVLFITLGCDSEPAKPAEISLNFEEAKDPTSYSSDEWISQKEGLHVSFATPDVRYAKGALPVIVQNNNWHGVAWRGERIHTQMLMWSGQDIQQINCRLSDFKSDKLSLPANIAQTFFVRYVLTDNTPGCGHRKPEDFPSSLSPDMLDTLQYINLDKQTCRPIWLSVNVPQHAQPGIYTAILNIEAQNQVSQQFNITLEVLDRTLPDPSEWQFHLDLWQHPSAIARLEGKEPVEVWSEEHWQQIVPYMKTLAQAGQKVITTTLNKDPWNVQTFDPYADMITWTKQIDGTWKYDFTVFDRWVKLMMDLGIKQQINCYSLVPWNNMIHYFDEKTAAYIDVEATPGSVIFSEMWTPFLKEFVAHLDQKQWTAITNIAMDERSPKEMQATIKFLKEVAPSLGIALADNHKSYKEYPYLKDICIGFESSFDEADLAYRKSKGLISTYYVCCSHDFPNMFTFSQPSETTYGIWYATAAGLDGMLHWSYNAWVENPLVDSRFRTWPAGDTYLIYPQNRSSIRFERLREGIQDVEKVRILRADFAAQSTTAAQDKLARLNAAVATFNTRENVSENCSQLINDAKQVLNGLSK